MSLTYNDGVETSAKLLDEVSTETTSSELAKLVRAQKLVGLEDPDAIQPCGHRLACFVGDDGGTLYCEVCEAKRKGALVVKLAVDQLVEGLR